MYHQVFGRGGGETVFFRFFGVNLDRMPSQTYVVSVLVWVATSYPAECMYNLRHTAGDLVSSFPVLVNLVA
jgi:hypothetical protein